MAHYRLEYVAANVTDGQRAANSVPDVTTAIVVAEINHQGRVAELWDGTRRIARLTRHDGGMRGFWCVTPG